MTDKKDILKKYVCLQPFTYLDVQTNGDYVCCPSWCPTNIRENEPGTWSSKAALDVRKSVVDGTYSHCDHEVCPALSALINTGEVASNFLTVDEFKLKFSPRDESNISDVECYPEEILLGFDRSCNLKCPSCRSQLIPNEDERSPAHLKKIETLNSLEEKFSANVKKFIVTGSGDPFYSKIYRNFLMNFDSSKYPNLEKIYLITNGQLVNKKLWDNLASAPYVKAFEISIDASSKKTYEEITRIGGSWDVLLENLKFVSTFEGLEFVIVSMVVSEKNYTEMEDFYKLMKSIFENSKFHYSINFRQHVFWGTGKYSENEVHNIQVFRKEHPLHEFFMNQLLKIHNKENVNHNFHHLIN